MIETSQLSYRFRNGAIGLHGVNLSLPSGSRTLLIGANGAGKSTLLRVLAGKTLAAQGIVNVDGRDPFQESLSGVSYLGSEWAANPTVRRDMSVAFLIASVGGDVYPDRRDLLVDILDIDLAWHMNAVSDGERRRVQLCMGLLRPWDTLLLDEVTVDLDTLVRQRLLEFLKNETMSRNCQIVYATHIFDGLMGWPTHIVHMHLGQVLRADTADLMVEKRDPRGLNSALMEQAYKWLREDFEARGARPRISYEEAKQSGTQLEHGDKFQSYFKETSGRDPQ